MANYLTIRLFPNDFETVQTVPVDGVRMYGGVYLDMGYSSGGVVSGVYRVLGYPHNYKWYGTTLTQVNPSRLKVGYVFAPPNPQTTVCNRLWCYVFSLKDPTNNPRCQFVSDFINPNGSTSSDTGSYDLTTNTGITDTKTGLPIYCTSIAGSPLDISNPNLIINFPDENYVYTNPNYPPAPPQELLNAINDGQWDYNIPTDPYAPAGESTTGGGEGDFDATSDLIPIPPLPTISVTDCGFVNIFNPTLAELQDLGTYMWTNPLFDLTNWRAIFDNPIDSIISLSILPVAIPDGGRKAIKVGNIATDVVMTQAATQFVELDCGTLNINEFWGSYLDYSPYTKLSIFMPYIGAKDLDVDECMNKSLHLEYQIDIFTGACSAFLEINGSVLYTFSGLCSLPIPVSGADFTNIFGGIMGAVSSVAGVAASGGLAVPGAVAEIGSLVSTVSNSKPHVIHAGSMGGGGGLLSVQTPYLILSRPNQALPHEQNTFTGYPVFISALISDLQGFTVVEEIHLQNISATDSEKEELKSILQKGVIL